MHPKANFGQDCPPEPSLAQENGFFHASDVINMPPTTGIDSFRQAQSFAETNYATNIPKDLRNLGVTPLVMGICHVLKPKLLRVSFLRGDWHYWDLYGDYQVSQHATWPAGGTRSPEVYWIPMWHDWYRILMGVDGVQRVTFDSEGCVVTVRRANQNPVSRNGSTPLEAIAKAGLELLEGSKTNPC